MPLEITYVNQSFVHDSIPCSTIDRSKVEDAYFDKEPLPSLTFPLPRIGKVAGSAYAHSTILLPELIVETIRTLHCP